MEACEFYPSADAENSLALATHLIFTDTDGSVVLSAKFNEGDVMKFEQHRWLWIVPAVIGMISLLYLVVAFAIHFPHNVVIKW